MSDSNLGILNLLSSYITLNYKKRCIEDIWKSIQVETDKNVYISKTM